MNRNLEWLMSIIRIVGSSFPRTSWLVQLQTEINSKELLERLDKYEDPISYLHKDIPELSRFVYQMLKLENSDSLKLEFNDEFYNKYSQALAILESNGYIKGCHILGKKYAFGFRLVDPSYILYLCYLEEDGKKMLSLINVVDSCKKGECLDGKTVQNSINLPIPVIKAVFDIFESKGYGWCSKEIGTIKYMGQLP